MVTVLVLAESCHGNNHCNFMSRAACTFFQYTLYAMDTEAYKTAIKPSLPIRRSRVVPPRSQNLATILRCEPPLNSATRTQLWMNDVPLANAPKRKALKELENPRTRGRLSPSLATFMSKPLDPKGSGHVLPQAKDKGKEVRNERPSQRRQPSRTGKNTAITKPPGSAVIQVDHDTALADEELTIDDAIPRLKLGSSSRRTGSPMNVEGLGATVQTLQEPQQSEGLEDYGMFAHLLLVHN